MKKQCGFWVVLTLGCAHVLAGQMDETNDNKTGLIRADGSSPFQNPVLDEDKFFLNWLQNVLGYKPSIATTTRRTPIESMTSTTNIPNVASKCPTCYCGIANKMTRIVGGHETEVNEYPWVALLMYKGRFYCGASVINSKYVLTAAHCVERFQKTYISVRILEHDRNSPNETFTQDFKAKEILKHQGYSTANYDNDIALIKIDGEIVFDNKIKPVCLAEKSKTFSGEMGIVTGWGAIEEGGPVSTTLREVAVPILSNVECRATRYPARKITDNMICAGYKEGQKDSCQGDSGGPLHVMSDGSHRIVGVVSWGEGCAQPGFPGVYSRVNRFITWIARNTVDACYCTEARNSKL
ncbi:hypothetical protein QAD02_023033 [Eretmocerus hayati]|uniref:Uncharacterized protein n=1 Tax=Eretmocerus hayati TaxID=131215 RepID=A0ACC2PVC2_9HYME|nr:hypothetical protein QAD02_023033 [Eretmocerus hayati]